MAISKRYVFKSEKNEYFIYDEILDTNVLKLSDLTAVIFNHLKMNKLPDDIAYILAKDLHIREDILIRDIEDFIYMLRKKGIYENN